MNRCIESWKSGLTYLSFLTVFLSFFIPKAHGQSNAETSIPIVFEAEPLPQDIETQLPPGPGTSGGSRDDCIDSPLMLQLQEETDVVEANFLLSPLALVPEVMHDFGYTTSDRPTLWIYNPYGFIGHSARLEIDDVNGTIARYTVDTLGENTGPGIISLTLPDMVPDLEIGTIYHWYFRLYCHSPDQFGIPITIRGSVMRTEPESRSDTHIWYDQLTSVGNHFRDNPDSEAWAQQWETLMRFVVRDDQLNYLTDTPIQDCCVLERPGDRP